MVHWTFYPVITTLIIGFIWFSYKYLKWASALDKLNQDHLEYLKHAPIEGIHYVKVKEAEI